MKGTTISYRRLQETANNYVAKPLRLVLFTLWQAGRWVLSKSAHLVGWRQDTSRHNPAA